MCVKHLTPPLARIYDHVFQVISLLTYENIIDYTIISNNFVRLKKGILVGCKSVTPQKTFGRVLRGTHMCAEQLPYLFKTSHLIINSSLQALSLLLRRFSCFLRNFFFVYCGLFHLCSHIFSCNGLALDFL